MLLQPHPGTILWTLITFVVVLVILRKTVWAPLLAALEEREQRIRDALQEAESARAAAAATAAENERRLAEAEAAATAAVEEARQSAAALRDRMMAEARAEAEQALAQARLTIEKERQEAVAELRREAATLAIMAAGRLLRANLDDERNRRLVDEAIDQIPTTPAAADQIRPLA